MLNMTSEATAKLASRADAPPAQGFRFPGFAAHYQDYEPSLDHFGFMRTGLNYMLMAPLDDEAYVTFRLNFHHFDRFELDLRGHTQVRGAAVSCPRLE